MVVGHYLVAIVHYPRLPLNPTASSTSLTFLREKELYRSFFKKPASAKNFWPPKRGGEEKAHKPQEQQGKQEEKDQRQKRETVSRGICILGKLYCRRWYRNRRRACHRYQNMDPWQVVSIISTLEDFWGETSVSSIQIPVKSSLSKTSVSMF